MWLSSNFNASTLSLFTAICTALLPLSSIKFTSIPGIFNASMFWQFTSSSRAHQPPLMPFSFQLTSMFGVFSRRVTTELFLLATAIIKPVSLTVSALTSAPLFSFNLCYGAVLARINKHGLRFRLYRKTTSHASWGPLLVILQFWILIKDNSLNAHILELENTKLSKNVNLPFGKNFSRNSSSFQEINFEGKPSCAHSAVYFNIVALS